MVNLTHFERKLITLIQHNNKKGRSPSPEEIEIRLGRSVNDIKQTIDNLVSKGWLEMKNGNLIVARKLF